MQDINQNPTYRANRKYYGHDLSQHVEFSSSVAQLLPVYFDVLNPGDKINVSTYLKSRTQPLAANTMTKIDEYLEWYFVPMTQIYKPYGNFFYGVQDFGSSSFYRDLVVPNQPLMSKTLPYVTSVDFYDLFDSTSLKKTLKGEAWWPAAVRLMQHLGIPDNVVLDDVEGLNPVTWSVAPILFCAYQKIWMDFYRDSNRIDNDARCYSLDKYFDLSNSIGNEMGADELFGMFELRYRPRVKDFYNNVFPSPLFGPGSVGSQEFNTERWDSTLQSVNQWLTNVINVYPVNQLGQTQTSYPTTTAITDDSVVAGFEFNRANVETLFAVDKLMEITRRAGKHYDAQTLAHFGVKVPDYIEGQAHFLGRHKQTMVIGDVISTADTSSGDTGAPLGEIGGKGFSGQNSKSISFQAPCHGVLMCLYSAVPSQDYYDYGLDKLNCLINKEDFYVPEFDNLGMQPLFGYQCALKNNFAKNSEIRGWQYRYSEFKQKIDRIFGSLKYTQKHWTAGIDPNFVAGSDPENYYCHPAALDPTMLYGYNMGCKDDYTTPVDTSSELWQSDPLNHELFVDCKKASQMSTYGLLDL